MAKEVIGRGWLTIAAIKDGKDGATGAKGDKGDDAGVMTFSLDTCRCQLRLCGSGDIPYCADEGQNIGVLAMPADAIGGRQLSWVVAIRA